jgi:hypothetical protein
MANDSRVRMADTGDHYLICDRSGACAAVEFLGGKTVFHTGEDIPVQALANDPYQRSVDAWQKGKPTNSSLKRFGVTADRVTDFQPMDAAAAVAYAFETLGQGCAGSGSTSWSIVFDTENLRVHFHTSRNPQVRYVDIFPGWISTVAPRWKRSTSTPRSPVTSAKGWSDFRSTTTSSAH